MPEVEGGRTFYPGGPVYSKEEYNKKLRNLLRDHMDKQRKKYENNTKPLQGPYGGQRTGAEENAIMKAIRKRQAIESNPPPGPGLGTGTLQMEKSNRIKKNKKNKKY